MSKILQCENIFCNGIYMSLNWSCIIIYWLYSHNKLIKDYSKLINYLLSLKLLLTLDSPVIIN